MKEGTLRSGLAAASPCGKIQIGKGLAENKSSKWEEGDHWRTVLGKEAKFQGSWKSKVERKEISCCACIVFFFLIKDFGVKYM